LALSAAKPNGGLRLFPHTADSTPLGFSRNNAGISPTYGPGRNEVGVPL